MSALWGARDHATANRLRLLYYCAHLFAYDFEAATRAAGGFEPAVVQSILLSAVDEEIRQARLARHWDRYRELWRWVFDADIDVAPSSWSPRVGDEAYRRAIVEFSVESNVLNQSDDTLREMAALLERAALPGEGPLEADVVSKRWRAYVLNLEVEVDVFQRTGLLARHPDELDEDTYLRVGKERGLAQVWERCVPAARQALLEASGLERDAIQLPPVSAHPSVCGHCGGRLLVVAESKRVLCESCGHLLDALRPRFPCPNCSAPVLVESSRQIECAYCRARFSPL